MNIIDNDLSMIIIRAIISSLLQIDTKTMTVLNLRWQVKCFS